MEKEKKNIIIEKKIFFEYKLSISYEEFIERWLFEIFSLNNINISLSNTTWTLLHEYKAYKNLFDIKYIIINDTKLKINIKTYLCLEIINNLFWFWLNIWLIRKIYKLLQFDIKEIFYAKNKHDWEIVIDVLNTYENSNKIEEITIGNCWKDVIRYKWTKDKRDKTLYKETYSNMALSYHKSIFNHIIEQTIYKENFKNNYIIEYIIFNILFLDENLYICIYKQNDCFITNGQNLNKIAKHPIITFNINKLFKPVIEHYNNNKTLIKAIKQKYWIKINNKNIDKYLQEIKEQFEEIWNITINIESKETDLDKRQYLDSKYTYSNIWFQKHNGKKKCIKIQRKFEI